MAMKGDGVEGKTPKLWQSGNDAKKFVFWLWKGVCEENVVYLEWVENIIWAGHSFFFRSNKKKKEKTTTDMKTW